MSVRKGDSVSYAVSGTFSATWQLRRSTGTGFTIVDSGTGAGSGTITAETDNVRLIFVCSAFTSGTMVTTITDLVPADVSRRVVPAATGKAGTTAGWLVATANNFLYLILCSVSYSIDTMC
jgi:uncharacterized membrane protein YedE/YeeE